MNNPESQFEVPVPPRKRKQGFWHLVKECLQNGGPGYLQFAITNICNAHCDFCGFSVDRFDRKQYKSVSLKEAYDVIDISVKAGALVLENGGETYRAEETCVRIARALGANEAYSFVTPTVVIVSVTDKDRRYHTAVRRITQRTVNLKKIARINSLSRRLASRNRPPVPWMVERSLERIRLSPEHNPLKIIIMAGFSSLFFALMFHGGLIEAGIAFCIGILLRIMLIFLDKFRLNNFIVSVISGGLISVLCEMVLFLGMIPDSVTVMTAVLMQVVPGLAIVNAIRDLIAGDLMAGTARLMEAFMVAAGLSAGSAFGILVFAHAVG